MIVAGRYRLQRRFAVDACRSLWHADDDVDHAGCTVRIVDIGVAGIHAARERFARGSAVLVAVRPELGAPLLFTSAMSKALQYEPDGFHWLDDRWTAQSWLYFTLALILLWGYSRPFSWQRPRAWWAGQPEPR